MKKISLLFSIFVTGYCMSQPILTKANTAPTIGDSYTYSRINWNGSPGASGANQTWDFSNIVTTTTVQMDFVSPSTCPSFSSFPTANVSTNIGSIQYDYNNITNSAWERVGLYATGVPVPYSNPEDILHFPFTYNNTYVDAFGGTFTSGILFQRAGTVTVTADGYGTLILPNSTINNVLRVKVVEDYGDSNNGSELYHYNIDIYMFYKIGIHTPILALTHYSQGSTVVNYGNYIDDPNLKIEKKKVEKISIYPVPASNQLFIDWNTESTSIKTIQVYNTLGSLIYTSTETINSIDISRFDNGIYFLHIWDGEDTVVKKFIKN